MAVPVLKELTAPAGGGRPEPRGRQARPGAADVARGRGGRCGRGDRRGRIPRPRRRSATGRRRFARTTFGDYLRQLEQARPAARSCSRREIQLSAARVRIAVLGVGLIGGSIGLAARERVEAAEVVGLRSRPGAARTARSSAERSTGPPSRCRAAVDGADACFACAPVGALPAPGAARARRPPGPRRVVTDVGSTKRFCWRPSTTRASSAATRSPAPRPPGVRARARRPLRGRRLVPDPGRALVGAPLRAPPPLIVAARGAAGRDRPGDPRPPAGDRQPPPARARQRAGRPGRGRLLDAGRAAAASRPELPRRHARGRRQLGDLDRHLPRQRRGDRRRDRRGGRSGCEQVAATLRTGGERDRGLERRAPREDRRRLLEAELAGGPVHELRIIGARTAPVSSRRWRWRSARRA